MILGTNQISELKNLKNDCLDLLYGNDNFIIDTATNERAVVFRFGIYLHDLLNASNFAGLDLDSEYNRRHGNLKRTASFPKGVIPDILIHQRDTQDHNILVMEFKGYWSRKNQENDFHKLKDFTAQDLDSSIIYSYGLGASVFITPNREDVKIIYFLNGKEE